MKRCLSILAFAACTVLSFSHRASAQAIPAARDPLAGRLTVGVAFSNARSDYTPKRLSGITGYATFTPTRHIGVEADARFLTLGTPNDFGERTYMAGPRFIYRKHRLEFYAKGLAGIGQTVAQGLYIMTNAVPSTSFAAAFGGGVDVRRPGKLTVRAFDYEYQDWPNFASDFGGKGLTPSVLTFGVAYRIR